MLTLPEIDWRAAETALTEHGWADLGHVIGAADAGALEQLYEDDGQFRSRVVMQRHGFGRGEYKYFREPLPGPVQALREGLYPGLAGVANAWNAKLGLDARFPASLAAMRALCARAGQTKPTPLLLRYGEGDYNCLHQDLYGDVVFPIQVVVLLSRPDAFEGGQFVLTEQRPRMQSRAEVVPLAQGRAVAFAVNDRPRLGKRGHHRVKQRHGVSRVLAGARTTLGVIFHDAR